MATIYLNANEAFALASGDHVVYGGTAGSESLLLNTGATAEMDGNVERVEFPGNVADYTFLVTGTTIQVLSGTTVVAEFAGLEQTTELSFADGTADLALTGVGAATLGGTAVPSGTAAAVVPGTIDATDTSSTAVAPDPSFSVATTAETAEANTATFTVTLDTAQATATTVDYAIQLDGGATAADVGDYTVDGTVDNTGTGTLTFAAGETTKTITVPVSFDSETETGETLGVMLSNAATGYDIGTANATTTLVDPTAPTYTLTSDGATQNDEGDTVTFTITPSGVVLENTTLTYSITGNTLGGAADAATSLDFSSASGSIMFTAGDTAAQSVAIDLTANDGTESLEGYTFTLLDSTPAALTSISGQIVDGSGAGGVGQSFTFTTGIDTPTGTAGNDTFIASSSGGSPTLNLGDTAHGGGGVDILSIVSNLAGAIPAPQTTSVETYQINSSANDTFAVNGLTTDLSAVNFTGGSNSTFTLSGIGTAVAIGMVNDAQQLTLTYSGVTGGADAASISLNGTATTASIGAADIETFNVATNGAASTLQSLTGPQGSTLNITGDQALTITTDLANTFTTVNASATTAGVNLGVATGGNVTMTGGTGNDRLHVAGLNTNDIISGGSAGTDTLAVDADVVAADLTNVTNIDRIEFTAATTQDLSLVNSTGVNAFVFSNAAGNAAYTNNTDTFFHVMSEKTAGNFAATAALDGPADVLNIELSNSDLTLLDASNYETVNLMSTVGNGGSAVLNTITTLTNSAAANVVITGSTDLTITNAIAAQGTVDASAFTGKLSVTGSAAADVIRGGSAVDTITAGVGADVVTGGGGADIFTIAFADSAPTAYDSITDMNTGGSDILRFAAADNVAAASAAAPVATASAQVSAGGKATFAAADDTLAERVTTLIAHTGINEVVFFEQGADTFVYGSGTVTDGSVDFLVKLTGVTNLTTLTEGATAGDFTLA